MALPTIGLRTFHRMALASAVGLGLLIVSGGLVRLTGSGLGCPDWPSCARTSLVGPLSYHKDVEFGNRLVSAVVTIVVVVTVAAAFRLLPRRRDLRILAVGITLGVLAQIGIGGLVVLYHLWPPLVMLHFLVSEGLVVLAVLLFVRSRQPEGRAVPIVARGLVVLTRVLITVTAVLVAVGTAVTGAGPNGGSQGAKRLPIPYRGVTELHATLAAFLVGLVVATLFATWVGDAPASVVRRAQVLLAAVVVQAAIGYAQFFLQVPAGLVDLHLAGATTVLGASVYLYMGLFTRVGQPPGPEGDGGARSRTGVARQRTSAHQGEGIPDALPGLDPAEAQSVL